MVHLLCMLPLSSRASNLHIKLWISTVIDNTLLPSSVVADGVDSPHPASAHSRMSDEFWQPEAIGSCSPTLKPGFFLLRTDLPGPSWADGHAAVPVLVSAHGDVDLGIWGRARWWKSNKDGSTLGAKSATAKLRSTDSVFTSLGPAPIMHPLREEGLDSMLHRNPVSSLAMSIGMPFLAITDISKALGITWNHPTYPTSFTIKYVYIIYIIICIVRWCYIYIYGIRIHGNYIWLSM